MLTATLPWARPLLARLRSAFGVVLLSLPQRNALFGLRVPKDVRVDITAPKTMLVPREKLSSSRERPARSFVVLLARQGRGVNFFTLIDDGERWRIMSIVWDNERTGLSLPKALTHGLREAK